MSQIKLYNLDCLSAMREMPDKAFELAVVDFELTQSLYRAIVTVTTANRKESI